MRTLIGLPIGAAFPTGDDFSPSRVIGRRIDCLGMTKGGAPRHPLYLKASSERRAYWSPVGR